MTLITPPHLLLLLLLSSSCLFFTQDFVYHQVVVVVQGGWWPSASSVAACLDPKGKGKENGGGGVDVVKCRRGRGGRRQQPWDGGSVNNFSRVPREVKKMFHGSPDANTEAAVRLLLKIQFRRERTRQGDVLLEALRTERCVWQLAINGRMGKRQTSQRTFKTFF